MSDGVEAISSEFTRTTVASQIVRYGIGTLRGVTFAALMSIYLVRVVLMIGQTFGGSYREPGNSSGAWLTLAFLVSLPIFAYLCTAQDKSGNFVAQSVVVTLLFLGYGVVSACLLLLILALSESVASVQEGIGLVGNFSPILVVGLTIILATIVRLAVAWEPAPKRLRVVRRWLYLAPPLFFLISEMLPSLARLAS